jgi:hypothetical protein
MRKSDFVCTACGYRGPMRSYGGVQIVLTVLLAIFMIIPGVIYALWVDAWRKRCPLCDLKALVPADSPRGRELSNSGKTK